MPFWGNERFKAKLHDIVPGGQPNRVQQGAYELSLGGEAYRAGEKTKETPADGGIVTIEPCQTALLLTEEEVRIPNGTIGFISVRSRTKGKGLVNISGFHVDPGFQGKLVFTVYNASPEAIVLNRGEQYFLLWIADMDPLQEAELHKGRQQSIPAESISQLRADPVSTVHLKKELDKFYGQRTLMIGALTAIVLALFTLVAEGFPWARLGAKFGDWWLPDSNQTQQKPSSTPAPASTGTTAAPPGAQATPPPRTTPSNP